MCICIIVWGSRTHCGRYTRNLLCVVSVHTTGDAAPELSSNQEDMVAPWYTSTHLLYLHWCWVVLIISSIMGLCIWKSPTSTVYIVWMWFDLGTNRSCWVWTLKWKLLCFAVENQMESVAIVRLGCHRPLLRLYMTKEIHYIHVVYWLRPRSVRCIMRLYFLCVLRYTFVK